MPAPQPLSLRDSIAALVSARVEDGGEYIDLRDEPWSSALKDATRLQREDVVEASILKARLFGLAGNSDQADYWLRNAEANGGKRQALRLRFDLSPLLGRPEWALENAEAVFKQCAAEGVGNLVATAVAHGLFSTAARFIDESIRGSQVTKLQNDVGMIRRAAKVLSESGIDEMFVARSVAVAADLLKERRMVWHGRQPLVAIFDEGVAAQHVSMRYRLKVSAEVAAELSWELSERLAQQDLLRDGLMVSFAVARRPVGAEVDALPA